MNSNPTNAATETVNGDNYPKVTTQTLGIANERVGDLAGYVFNPKEISTAAVKFFSMYSIDVSDIYAIKVGTTKDNELKIYAEIRASVLKEKKKKSHSFLEFEDYSTEQHLVSDFYYKAWHNKLYHGKKKNLQARSIKRNGDKYVSIAIDPMIFIAFVYNINFLDRMYRISAPAKRWLSNKALDELSGKERKKYRAMQTEYSNYGITQCTVVVTFSLNCDYTLPNGNKITGFHPNQVDDFYSNDD